MENVSRGPIALSALAVGSFARLHEARLDAESAGLLRALGLSSTRELRLCKAGEPCIVQVGGTRIGVSRDVASRILVIPNGPAAG
jgi:Fe2+ transport system protein FeoA